LRARDTAFVAISQVPPAKLQAYQQRMGWSFTWLSSFGNDFNRDFRVTFSQDEVDDRRPHYNFDTLPAFDTQLPGISVFYKDGEGNVYHTYSTYSRGIDIANGAYNYLDMTPKGRDEAEGEEMSWLRCHDQYDA
jgi:predicted dithiol-disulfide oxidoreductase (DUF899 family)